MNSLFRKISPAIWPNASSASTYGHLDVDLNHYYQKNPEQKQKSPLPLVLFLLFQSMRKSQEVRRVLVWKTIFRKRKFSYVLPVDSKGGDLRFFRLEPDPEWNLAHYEKIFSDNDHQKFRDKSEKQLGWSFHILRWIPSISIPSLLSLLDFLIYELKIPPPMFGFKNEPFGPVVVSNFGSLGLKSAFAPLIPICRNVMTIGIGKLQDGILPISFTIDHRYVDGSHCSIMFDDFQKFVEEL